MADEFEHGMEVMPFVERACLAVEFLEDKVEDCLPVGIAAHGGGDGFDSGRAHMDRGFCCFLNLCHAACKQKSPHLR